MVIQTLNAFQLFMSIEYITCLSKVIYYCVSYMFPVFFYKKSLGYPPAVLSFFTIVRCSVPLGQLLNGLVARLRSFLPGTLC